MKMAVKVIAQMSPEFSHFCKLRQFLLNSFFSIFACAHI